MGINFGGCPGQVEQVNLSQRTNPMYSYRCPGALSDCRRMPRTHRGNFRRTEWPYGVGLYAIPYRQVGRFISRKLISSGMGNPVSPGKRILHAAIGAFLHWRCLAFGRPIIHYSSYRVRSLWNRARRRSCGCGVCCFIQAPNRWTEWRFAIGPYA